MKFIMSNVATQMGNLLSFYMVVLVEVEVKLSEDSLIRRLIELLCLIKEDVAEVKPHACLTNNTTWDLVDDIESLKQKLGINKWLVFGGSWGSTLALAYAQTHPDSVSEMVLRGIFMLRKKELDWFYQDGASRIFPEAWKNFINQIDESKRDNLMQAYHEIFVGSDQSKSLNAAIAWSKWEAACSSINYSPERVEEFSNPEFALAFALIENHYFMNAGFLDDENQLLDGVEKI
jgi:proline iminopeptidase